MRPARPSREPDGVLVVLSGPSGVGKGTVVAAAMAKAGSRPASGRAGGLPPLLRQAARRLRRSVSATTRSPRPEEREGKDYFFRSPRQFAEMVRRGELLEHASYLNHRYGTPRQWVDQQLAAGRDVVLEIEVKGGMQVRKRRPKAVLIYMLPPSRPALKQRLARRRSEPVEVQRRRLEVAKYEMRYLKHYDYVIVNDRVWRAASELLAILAAERARVARLSRGPVARPEGARQRP